MKSDLWLLGELCFSRTSSPDPHRCDVTKGADPSLPPLKKLSNLAVLFLLQTDDNTNNLI